jgi:hypothetical protein
MMHTPQPTWSTHDAAVWHTVDIVQAALASRLDERPAIHAPFPPRHGVGERLLAQGDFQLYTHTSVGDGSYQHSDGFFFATGGVGLALTAGFAVAQAAGNASRRNRAAQDAVPRWLLSDRGLMWVSTAGFYLQTVNGLFPWAWQHIQSAQLLAPATLHLQGQSDTGSVSWLIVSDWAELAFVLWALQMHPQHPMLTQMTWVPPGWQQRCVQAGYAPPRRRPSPDTLLEGRAAARLEVGHDTDVHPVAGTVAPKSAPATGQSETDQSDIGQSETDQSDIGQSETDQPDIGQSDIGQSDTGPAETGSQGSQQVQARQVQIGHADIGQVTEMDAVAMRVAVPDGTTPGPASQAQTPGAPTEGAATDAARTDIAPTDAARTDIAPTDGAPTHGTPTHGTQTSAPTDGAQNPGARTGGEGITLAKRRRPAD